MPRSGELQLGQRLVQKRVCTLRQVNEAIAMQRQLRAQGSTRRLGWILMQKGYVREEDLRRTLAEMNVLELFCPACREQNAIASYSPGTEYRCPRCRTPLVLDEPEAAPADGLKSAAPLESVPVPPPAEGRGDPMISKVIGGCQILKRIARGGMGVVYMARQLNLGRTVAIKILSEDLSKDRTYVQRFIHEARSAAVLSHGNIVHINDVGEHNGIFYFIMEYVEGENLREIMRREGPIAVGRTLEIAIQVAQALQHAHGRGIVHRDIKPENIMVTPEGIAKLTDMGLAKRVTPGAANEITHAGSILGTPFYMAPEQAKDFSQVDNRSDIYSLGVTLYRAITGMVPFDGRSPIEVMIKAIDGRHALVREVKHDAPPEVEALVEKMMHREPEKRFQSAGALIDAIRNVQAVLARPAAAAAQPEAPAERREPDPAPPQEKAGEPIAEASGAPGCG